MNDFLTGLARFFLRLLLLALGLVFAAFLVLAVVLLAAIWALRAGWARLTGRPVTPWVMRYRPQDGWSRFNRRPGQAPAQGDGPPRGYLADTSSPADVTDVEVKEPKS